MSISYCTSAVLAVEEPFAGPRRSTTTTRNPLSRSASATIAPVMPAPITSTSELKIVPQRLVGKRRGALLQPDGAAGPQIFCFGDHGNACLKLTRT